MRSHPVVGSFFVLSAVVLFTLGATARQAPAFLSHGPLPPQVTVPFFFWQLAVWAALFGIFFLRPRGRGRGLQARPAFRV